MLVLFKLQVLLISSHITWFLSFLKINKSCFWAASQKVSCNEAFACFFYQPFSRGLVYCYVKVNFFHVSISLHVTAFIMVDFICQPEFDWWRLFVLLFQDLSLLTDTILFLSIECYWFVDTTRCKQLGYLSLKRPRVGYSLPLGVPPY